jgi:hypothetical protein
MKTEEWRDVYCAEGVTGLKRVHDTKKCKVLCCEVCSVIECPYQDKRHFGARYVCTGLGQARDANSWEECPACADAKRGYPPDMGMTVGQLIAILKTCDQSLPIAVHANNHTHHSKDSHAGKMRVVQMRYYDGAHVCIGNVSKMNINGLNWHATRVLDGGKPIPEEWER